MGYDTVLFRTTMNNDVYVCSDGSGSRRVAVKLLHNTRPEMKEKFLNEIKILESLRHHPSVPRILFSATADGYPYFGSEWATGKIAGRRESWVRDWFRDFIAKDPR
jgi:serine/threonine protein kinase